MFPRIRHKAGMTVECLPRRNGRFPAPASSSRDYHRWLLDEPTFFSFIFVGALSEVCLPICFACLSPGNLRGSLFLCVSRKQLIASLCLTPTIILLWVFDQQKWTTFMHLCTRIVVNRGLRKPWIVENATKPSLQDHFRISRAPRLS